MKLLPIIMEQSIDRVSEKLSFFIKNQSTTVQETKQDILSFGVYVVCPSFSSIYNVPSTISLSSIFGESQSLLQDKVNLYINYLATGEDLMSNVPETMNYEFLPANWNVKMYVPIDVLGKFKLETDKVDNLGGLIYLRELNQETITNFKASGCHDFSLLGRHIILPGEVTDLEINNIVKIITDNTDCNFIVNSEMDIVVSQIEHLNHVQICVNKAFWLNKLEN
jgi:hypothetical protein